MRRRSRGFRLLRSRQFCAGTRGGGLLWQLSLLRWRGVSGNVCKGRKGGGEVLDVGDGEAENKHPEETED